MNQKSKTDLNYESIVNGRPLSEQGIDIHVYVVPLPLWRDNLRSADSQTVITESISAGFVRVMPDAIVNSLRIDIENQLGFETVPRNFVFLRCVGRCFTAIKAKQEYSIKAKNFTPPETFAPEIFLMELTTDIRSILTSSQSNKSNLKNGRGHQKRNSHMTTPHHKPNKSEGGLPPHLNNSRLTGSISEDEEEDVDDEEDDKDKDEKRRPSQVRRQLTVTKTSAAATGDYILTPNSKFTQTMEEKNNADKEEDAENRTRLKRKEDEQRRNEMLRRLALEQQREEQWKSDEMARKEAEAKREEELRKKQEEELRKRLGEEDRSKREEEERKWLEEMNRRQLEKRKKQEEELRKKLEEEQRRRKEEEMRRKQEEEEELKRKQEDELKKKLEEQQKRMTNEELRRKLEEELRRKQDEELRRNQDEELRRKQEEERRNQEEELRRKQEDELRRKQDEERRRNQGEELRRRQEEEELRRKQEEERRRKQDDEKIRKQDELNRKKEEEQRKKMTAEQQKAADKAALLKEIERLREDRKMQELRKDELTKKVKSLQDRSQMNQNNARDSWRKRYLEEKKKTPPLNSDCSQLKKDLNAINKKILSNVESTSHVINHGVNQKPSEKSNLKIQAIRLRMEIEDLKSRLDNMNMKLTAELKLRTQAEDELQLLRKNQFLRKKGKPLSVVHVKQALIAGRGGGRREGGGGTGGGKTDGSQRGLNSMQQLPPVA